MRHIEKVLDYERQKLDRMVKYLDFEVNKEKILKQSQKVDVLLNRYMKYIENKNNRKRGSNV
ncbi:MAG: Spo0E family sporulation regulatory protein-aspartic acid phosphatase [Caloramator sp.]|nr:Spo0E family sporulation regulatory protein-aspartic acid phosphatase [Caloramator sp.]